MLSTFFYLTTYFSMPQTVNVTRLNRQVPPEESRPHRYHIGHILFLFLASRVSVLYD